MASKDNITKGETIEYAIKKKCQEYSLVDWCEEWGITVDEFYGDRSNYGTKCYIFRIK